MVKLLQGMFVISIWDNKENFLYLARDRAGEKPLYYSANENFFIFASFIKIVSKNHYFLMMKLINNLYLI